MNNLSYQQTAVMDNTNARLKSLYEFNNGLRTRVTAICAASTAIVGIVTAANFLPTSTTASIVESALLAFVCLLSVVLYWFAGKALLPVIAPIAGTTDTDKLYDGYLSQKKDIAYNNLLIDLCATCDLALQTNESHAQTLKIIIQVFQLQVFLLAVSIGWGAIA